MHVFWASVFMLPVKVTKELESKMRGFLWSQGQLTKGAAKVSWKMVCTPKAEGGLDIRRIGDMNKSLLASHLWSLLIKRHSLWVTWIYTHRLRGRTLWNTTEDTKCCSSWRDLCLVRNTVRDYVWCKIGNGQQASAWFDRWNSAGPLSSFITPRLIHSAGFHLDSNVAALVNDGSWSCHLIGRLDFLSLDIYRYRSSTILKIFICGR
jgi:hypothetical protein